MTPDSAAPAERRPASWTPAPGETPDSGAIGGWRLARGAGCLGVLGLLSACAGSHHLSASQEASRYESTARQDYVAPGPASDPWGPYIHEASERYDIPERWVREVMRVESGGRTEMGGRPITSGAGAMGLMQVMPATYDELRSRYGFGPDPYDPHNSILAGTAYIRELYDLYGSPGFLAAYNGGPGRLDDYLTRNRPLADETRRYVAKIGPYITDTFPKKRSMAEEYAMNTLPTSIPAGPRYAAQPTAVATYLPPAAPVAPAVSAPVEVAYAPPSSGDGAFDPPPGWTPRNAQPSAVASYAPPAPPAAIEPARVAMADPAPLPFAANLPLPTPPAPAVEAIPAPPIYAAQAQRAEPVYPRPSAPRTAVAALPEPPPFVPSVQTAAAYAPANTLQHHEAGYRLIPTAMAAPAPVYRGGSGQWAIQVGAFGNEGLAHIAVGNAREQAAGPLASARPAVASVREQHGTLYRARLVGLSRDAASEACERLSRARNSCIVLSPEAQN